MGTERSVEEEGGPKVQQPPVPLSLPDSPSPFDSIYMSVMQKCELLNELGCWQLDVFTGWFIQGHTCLLGIFRMGRMVLQ
ncbi:hypothetical protein JZ751_001479 [Albula glossodonta]|uniref:Uncharacterized protein n=1 Tax=Albula glossodonta TaxID=121402 RepID=A0A8T2PU20_9TELE|nr:hypothetical protein JZ751_001479 [Albula glossodonta]